MRRLYWLNVALLGAHELDAGYLTHWERLALPGGASGFVAAHAVAVLVVLLGYEAVVEERRSAIAWTVALGLAGLAAAGAHGALVWLGRAELRSWASIAALAGLVLVSLLQLAAARFEARIRSRSAGRGNRVFFELREG